MRSKHPYLLSLFTAFLTAVFIALIVLAIGKYLSSKLASDTPLYNANSGVYAVVGDSNVDKEVNDIPAQIKPVVPAIATTSPAALKVTASSYLVVELDSSIPDDIGKVIVQKNAEQAQPIASLTKLATAVVAKDLLDQDDEITIGPKILSTYGGDPAGFHNGEELKVSQLYYPLLMVSSNDAGEALALSYGPGRIWFIKAMNDWAYSIGAYNTYFADPTGLSPENVSSPHDIAIMLAWIKKHDPDLMAITGLKVKYLGAHTWVSPTALLNLSSYLGGKNGYLPQAGETSVSLFDLTKTGQTALKQYIVVTLGSANRDQDVLKLLQEI